MILINLISCLMRWVILSCGNHPQRTSRSKVPVLSHSILFFSVLLEGSGGLENSMSRVADTCLSRRFQRPPEFVFAFLRRKARGNLHVFCRAVTCSRNSLKTRWWRDEAELSHWGSSDRLLQHLEFQVVLCMRLTSFHGYKSSSEKNLSVSCQSTTAPSNSSPKGSHASRNAACLGPKFDPPASLPAKPDKELRSSD
jgi:hypothetical protein